tara:strand:+ start:651 stop:1292 length:642 start_codon:yes stop_codon:yes gene_type:complete
MSIKKLLVVSLSLSFFINVEANVAPPSQLDWGKTKTQMIMSGYQLESCKFALDNAIEYCRVNNIKKPISFAETYTIYFVDGYGLMKAFVQGKDITNDTYGSDGKSQYQKIKSSLITKYPDIDGYQTQSFEWTARKLYKESDEFYECLNYDGCGSHISYIYSSNESVEKGTVSVELKGYGRGQGALNLTYESSFWSEALDAAQNKQNQADDDAL